MTVQTTTSRADYTGNGVTTAFTVPFYFLDNSHLLVLRTQISTSTTTTLALTTDYTVSGAGVGAGGTVTMVVAPTSDQKISILRNVPQTQLIHYVPNDPFPAASHEQALDQLTMEVQQLNEAQNRALSLSKATTGVSATLPNPSANLVIGWDATATQLVNVDANTLATSIAYGQTLSQTASGNGSNKGFTLSSSAAVANNVQVFISGVRQVPTTDYTLAPDGVSLTFVTAPPSGTNNILFVWQAVLPMPTIFDNTVTTSKIVDGNVTTAKLADGSVTTVKHADASVTAAKLAAGAAVSNIGYTPLNPANNLSDVTAATARTNLGVTATGSDTTYAYRANNLSDLASASTARTNLGVTATGSDTTYAYRANNLSDLASVSTARTNLGVTATGSDTTYAYRANNLSDLANAGTARTNLGLGSIATQAASSVAITGGAIDGTPVGATTAAAGKFTTLSASGTFRQNDATNSYGYTVTTSSAKTVTAALFGGGYYAWQVNNSGADAMTLNASGQFALGTSSPANGALLTLQESASNSAALTMINRNSTQKWTITVDAAAVDDKILAVIDASASAYRMGIDTSGNLLVGRTSAPLANAVGVSIYGTGIIAAERAGTVGYFNMSSGTGSLIEFRQANSTVGSISVTGSTTAYNTSSDYRLKENIQPMTGALAKVAALKPVTYKWKADGSDGEGFIAHELAEVCPHAVTGEKDATEVRQFQVGTRKVTKTRQVTDKTIIMEEQIVLVDGKHVLRMVEKVVEQGLVEQLPVYNEDGSIATVTIPAVLDEEGNVVTPETTVPRTTAVPVMEEYEEDEPVFEDRVVPKYQGIDTSFLAGLYAAAIQELKAEFDAYKATHP